MSFRDLRKAAVDLIEKNNQGRVLERVKREDRKTRAEVVMGRKRTKAQLPQASGARIKRSMQIFLSPISLQHGMSISLKFGKILESNGQCSLAHKVSSPKRHMSSRPQEL